MIDFRYHLVSLISVFLALAVGIVLGAGPLKQPIGESLQSQVESLRTDRDNLRGQLEESRGDTTKLNSFVVAEAPSLLNEKLKGRTVSVIHAADADGDQLKAVNARLGDAGAAAVDAGGLTATTFSDDGRADFIKTLRGFDGSLPTDDTEAISTALAKAWSVDRGTQPYNVETAANVIKAFKDAGRLNGGAAQKSEALIFVAGSTTGAASNPTPTAGSATDVAEAFTELVNTMGTRIPAVVAGTSGNASSGLVANLRGNNPKVTTTDGLELAAGAVIAALAVEQRISTGKNIAYGFGSDTTELVPGVAKN